jgi:hypothetical protein
MTTKLTEELRQAIARQPGEPLQLEDPITHALYVLVQLDIYERLQRGFEYDTSEPDPRLFYPAFADAVKDELDAPGMANYDEDESPRNQ